MISKARNVGAITNEIYRQLQNHLKKEKLKLHIAEVSHADIVTSDLILLNLKKEDSIAANEIILATGFEKQRPGGILVDSLVDQYGLVCAKCGYPIPKQTLEWGNDIFVTGPLAELEIGPASPNIIGARHAGERISTVF